MASVTIKQHDTARSLEDILKLDGSPIDLTGASVSVVVRNKDSRVSWKKTATIVDAAAGQVRYSFDSSDVSVDGVFEQEWEIVLPGGFPMSVPDDGYNTLNIVKDLG